MPAHVRDGGAWRAVNGVWVRNADAWRSVRAGWVWSDGAWKQWMNDDPEPTWRIEGVSGSYPISYPTLTSPTMPPMADAGLSLTEFAIEAWVKFGVLAPEPYVRDGPLVWVRGTDAPGIQHNAYFSLFGSQLAVPAAFLGVVPGSSSWHPAASWNDGGTQKALQSPNGLPSGWHHLVFSFQPTVRNLYVDGVLKAQDVSVADHVIVAQLEAGVRLGTMEQPDGTVPGGTMLNRAGGLGSVRWWNHAMLLAEVQAEYAKNDPVSDT